MLPLTPILIDQLLDAVATFARASRAFDAQHIELAFDISDAR
jgi:hypothetical protein